MMSMNMRVVAGSLLCFTLSACVDEPAPIGTDQEEILGGDLASVGQFPTVVAIVNAGLCTGTLVGPDLVLTAAHCISPSVLGYSSQDQVTADTRIIIDSVNLFQAGGQQIGVADTIPHPGFSLNSLGDNDIGLVRLATPVTDRPASVINRISSDAPAGIVVTQVGFGMTQVGNQNSVGVLNVLADKVSRTCNSFEGSNDLLLCFNQSDGTGKCSGDSGGPSFAMVGGIERVVGVTSFGDQNCTQFGADTRVDAETAFLYEHAPELQCQADGICNQSCAVGTLPIDADCPVCEIDDDCGENQVCSDGQCVAAPFTPGGLGSTCETSDDCDSGLCATQGDESQCTDTCDPAASTCPDGFECIAAGSGGVCWGSEGGGGCRSSTGGGLPLALLGVALLAVRRRRRR